MRHPCCPVVASSQHNIRKMSSDRKIRWTSAMSALRSPNTEPSKSPGTSGERLRHASDHHPSVHRRRGCRPSCAGAGAGQPRHHQRRGRRTDGHRRRAGGRHARTQRQRHRRHRHAPCRATRRRTDLDQRGQPGSVAEFRRHRHPPDDATGPVAHHFLDRVGSERLGPRARHRHGRRQSGAGKLGDGLHRRRVPQPHRLRPQRSRRGRPGGGAARAAGHAVGPQLLGGRDQHLYQGAVVRFRRLCRGDVRQLRFLSRRRRGDRADREGSARLPHRRRGIEARRLLPRCRQRHRL